jgi:hypothetical protein
MKKKCNLRPIINLLLINYNSIFDGTGSITIVKCQQLINLSVFLDICLFRKDRSKIVRKAQHQCVCMGLRK